MAETATPLAASAILTRKEIADIALTSKVGTIDVQHHLPTFGPSRACQAESAGSRQSLHDGHVPITWGDPDRGRRRSGATLHAVDRQWRAFLTWGRPH